MSTGLQYIRNSRQLYEQGLYVELEAYKYHVFLDWEVVRDDEWHQYAHLNDYLDGRGVPSIDEVLREIFLQPIHGAFKELVNAGMFRWLLDNRAASAPEPAEPVSFSPHGVDQAQQAIPREISLVQALDEVEQKTVQLLREIKQVTHGSGDESAIARSTRRKVEAILQLPVLEERFPWPGSRKYKSAVKYLQAGLGEDMRTWGTLLGWVMVHELGKVVQETNFEQQSRSWIDEWLLGKIIAAVLQDLGLDEAAAWQSVAIVKLLTTHQCWFDAETPRKKRAYQALEIILKDQEAQRLLQVNRYQGLLWFNKEAFERMLWWMLILAVIEEASAPGERPADEVARRIVEHYDVVHELQKAEAKSEYQVEKLVEAVAAGS